MSSPGAQSRFDRTRLDRALRLLAKAESTQSCEEAVALAQKSYRLLAEMINLYEESSGTTRIGLRRRERRLLNDRRRSQPTPEPPSAPPRVVARDRNVERYRDLAAVNPPRVRTALLDLHI
ncbi:MAG: hypothetical protein ACP5P1_02630 [Acidimicrobiales bacterium]